MAIIRKAIKGFSRLRMWPVTTNDDTAYVTGVMAKFTGAQSASVSRETDSFVIYADDDVYDEGVEFKSETFDISVAELPLDLEASLDGAEYDEAKEEYTFKSDSEAPEIALGWAALKRDKSYRMIKYYSCRVQSIKMDYETKGEKNDIKPYKITVKALKRRKDNSVVKKHDGSDLTWLDTIDNIPVAGG